MPSADCVIALTTLPAAADAHTFARTLVEERLAACVNILPEMSSIYRWEGKVEQETERQMVMKTSRARVGALLARVRELHSYDVPEFIVIPIIEGSDSYLTWVTESTAPATTR
jgi:periplasmic divalent cation tolerance protein